MRRWPAGTRSPPTAPGSSRSAGPTAARTRTSGGRRGRALPPASTSCRRVSTRSAAGAPVTLVDAVITPGGDALVGSWGGAKAGLDAAVWTFADRVWTRQDPAGTALESTATLLVGPRGATGDGDGVLVTGSALHLDQGVDQTAAVWRSSGVNTGWHRIDLPGAGTHSEAVSAQCSTPPPGPASSRARSTSRLALSGPPRGPRDRTGRTTRPSASGTRTSSPDRCRPDRTPSSSVPPRARAWSSAARPRAGSTSAGPTGLPVAAALVGDRLYVATRPTAGAAANLFVARWPG